MGKITCKVISNRNHLLSALKIMKIMITLNIEKQKFHIEKVSFVLSANNVNYDESYVVRLKKVHLLASTF